MIKVTGNAHKQILVSIEKGNAKGLGLRVAARKGPDGSFQYAMGFDEIKPDDIVTEEGDVRIVFAPDMKPLVDGMTIEFDVVEEGSEPMFIFLNPNDPSYVPPAE
jgi:iron-sulfur cluster assembly protein